MTALDCFQGFVVQHTLHTLQSMQLLLQWYTALKADRTASISNDSLGYGCTSERAPSSLKAHQHRWCFNITAHMSATQPLAASA